MKLAVEVGSRTHTVEVRRSRDGEHVSLNGQEIAVDFSPAGRFWSLKLGPPSGGPQQAAAAGVSRPPSRSYEIALADEAGGVTMVHVNGRAVPVVVTGAGHFGAAARRARPMPEGAEGPQQLRAPMPGRIVKLLARVGEAVTMRQGLVVIEAMKMENELRSPKSGTLTEIRVSEGVSVEAGTLLVVVE